MANVTVMSGNKSIQNKKVKDKTPEVPQKILNSPVSEVILDQWNKIPAVEEVYHLETFKVMSQGVRSQIVDLFREGISELNPISKQIIIRHVFSAKEILYHVESNLDTDLTLQNIYFHLSKLEDAGIITRVASIKEGRHSTHYFGRKARLFLHVGATSKMDFMTDEKLQKLSSLLEKLNPGITLQNQVELFNELEESTNKARERIKYWMEKNEKLIIELNIDFRDIYEMLYMIDRFDNSTIEISRKIARLFKYPQDNS